MKWVALPPVAKFKEQDRPGGKILCYKRTDNQEIKAWATKGAHLLKILSCFASRETPQ